MVHISAPRTQVHLNILERLFTGDRKEECWSFLFFFHSTWKNFIFSVSFLFFSIYLKERQLSIRIGSFPAVCPSGRVSRGTNKRGDSLLTWTRAFLGGPKFQFSMESGNWRYTRKGKEDGHLVQYVLKWTHAFMDGLKVHFFHATALPLSLKAFLFESFYRKSRA